MSGMTKQLTAADGHTLDAYIAQPKGAPIGALVIVQEIFGINAYIRSVADRYAEQGYLAVAPPLFDRSERGVELTYEGEDMKRAVSLMQKLDSKTALMDVAAGFIEAKSAGKGVGVVGFCYGGYMSWLAATRGEEVKIRPDCCVCYYPGGIGTVAKEDPSCPVMMHFGMSDTHIGLDLVEAVRTAHPEVELFLYEGAEHGFSCDARAAFNPQAAALAQERTLKFLATHLA